MVSDIYYSTLIMKALGLISIVSIIYITFLTVKHSQIEKFGGGPDHAENVNAEINELKKKTIFKLITNYYIIVIIGITILCNILIPEAVNNQVTLAIFISGITSLGIKLGLDLGSK